MYLSYINQKQDQQMEGVGNQVIIGLAFPVLAIAVIIGYQWRDIQEFIRRQLGDPVVRIEETEEERLRRQQHNNDQTCSICLGQPKNLPVSSTCGHSFCLDCIFTLYEHVHNRIKCPLCRQQITVMFKLFQSTPETHEAEQKLKQYNQAFDDTRPFLRRLSELPYVLRRIMVFVWRPEFILFFFRSVRLFRMLFIVLFYILMPFDIIPERIVGIIGYIDDILVTLLIVSFFVAIAAIQYLRYRGNA